MKAGESTDQGTQGQAQGNGAAAPEKRKRTRAEAKAAVADLLSQADAGDKADQGKADAGDKAKARQDAPGEAADAGKAKGADAGAAARQGDGDKAGAPAKPKTWKEAAERLGLEPDELYSLELDLAANKGKATLGQVKDFLQTHGLEAGEISELIGKSRTELEAATKAREESNAEANVIRRDLVGIIGAMGHVPPEVIAKVRQAQTRRLERELSLTLDAAPEWKDPKVFAQDKAEIAGILGKYGFSAKELDAVDDSRLLLFLRDTLQRRRAARAALDGKGESPDDVTRTAQGPSSRGITNHAARAGMSARIAAAKAGGRESKIAAISALLSRKG